MNDHLINITASETPPRFDFEDPVLVDVNLTRSGGHTLPPEALEGFFDTSALLALPAGSKIEGRGWTDLALWVQVAQECATAFAQVLNGSITCPSKDQRVIFRDGKALQVQGKTIYPEPGEVLCPFCQGPTKYVRGVHIEGGPWDGKNYALDTQVAGHLCQGDCRAYFFTGLTQGDLDDSESANPESVDAPDQVNRPRKVWIVTTCTNNGVASSLHPSEEEAKKEVEDFERRYAAEIAEDSDRHWAQCEKAFMPDPAAKDKVSTPPINRESASAALPSAARPPERIERFILKITRPAIPEQTAIRVLRNEIQQAIDKEGVPHGWFNITACQTRDDLQVFTLVHERSLDYENEVFERTSDPTDEQAMKQILGEFEDAKAYAGALWQAVEFVSREVDATGHWQTREAA